MHAIVNIVPDLILVANAELHTVLHRFPSNFLTSKKLTIDVMRRAYCKSLRCRGPVILEAELLHDCNYSPSPQIANYSTSSHIGMKRVGIPRNRTENSHPDRGSVLGSGYSRTINQASFQYDFEATIPEEMSKDLLPPQTERVPAYDYEGVPSEERNSRSEPYHTGLTERNNNSQYHRVIFDIGKALSDRTRASQSGSVVRVELIVPSEARQGTYVENPLCILSAQDGHHLSKLNRENYCLEIAESLMRKGGAKALHSRQSFPKKFMGGLNNPQRPSSQQAATDVSNSQHSDLQEYLQTKVHKSRQQLWIHHLLKMSKHMADMKARHALLSSLKDALSPYRGQSTGSLPVVVNSRALLFECLSSGATLVPDR